MPFEIFLIPGLLFALLGFYKGRVYWSEVNASKTTKTK